MSRSPIDSPPYQLIEFQQLPSTNAFALEHLNELRHGDVIAARTQTAGRGRLNRSWLSDHPHNVSLSIVLKPASAHTSSLGALTHYLALVVCRTLDRYGVVPAIKWPNDVQVAHQKIAGILAENLFVGDRCLGIVLGVGVNINLYRTALASIDQPATTLNLLIGHSVDRDEFVRRLLDGFFANVDGFLVAGFPSIRNEYLQRASFLGQRIVVRQSSTEWTGTATDLDPSGALWLKTDDARLHLFHAGDAHTAVCAPS